MLVDVGKLLALGVDLEVVGVALQHRHGLLYVGDDPGIEHREADPLRRELLPADDVLGVEQVPPLARGQRPLLDHVLQLGQRRVVGMELLQVVLGLDQLLVAAPAVDGELDQEAPVGLGKADSEGVVVDHLERHRRAGGGAAVAQPVREAGRQLLVQQYVLVGEQHVIHRHRHAVGPLQSRTQAQRKDAVAVAHLEALQHVAHHVAQLVVNDVSR